jgi:hypothetical protein
MSLIPNWRHAWKFWSVILGVLGLAAECADLFLPVWNMLPDDVAAIIPPVALRIVGTGLWGLALLSRVIKQDSAHDKAES